MNTHEEIWETIFNEVAYLNGGSLDARKGSLAEQAADILTPFVMALLPGRTEAEVKAEALDEFATERYIAYLEDPSLPWADQPSKLSQWYAKTAEELRTRAARLRGESNG